MEGIGKTRRGRLHEAGSWCLHEGAPSIEEHGKRSRPGRGSGRTPAVPIDFAPSSGNGSSSVAVINAADRGAELIHRRLNRGRSRPGCLEYDRRIGHRLLLKFVIIVVMGLREQR